MLFLFSKLEKKWPKFIFDYFEYLVSPLLGLLFCLLCVKLFFLLLDGVCLCVCVFSIWNDLKKIRLWLRRNSFSYYYSACSTYCNRKEILSSCKAVCVWAALVALVCVGRPSRRLAPWGPSPKHTVALSRQVCGFFVVRPELLCL